MSTSLAAADETQWLLLEAANPAAAASFNNRCHSPDSRRHHAYDDDDDGSSLRCPLSSNTRRHNEHGTVCRPHYYQTKILLCCLLLLSVTVMVMVVSAYNNNNNAGNDGIMSHSDVVFHASKKATLLRHMEKENDGIDIAEKDELQTFATQSLQDNLNNNLTQIPQWTKKTTNYSTSTTTSLQRHCETTVLLFRHCDDHGIYAQDDQESGDKHCSYMGYLRAEYIPTLFLERWSNNNNNNNRPSPTLFLYAQLPEQPQGTNFRQIETLLPLARQENVTIHVVRDPFQISNAMFDRIRSHPDDVCGTVTIVAWKHAFIPQVAAHLGCGPEQGCPMEYPDDTFDQVWQLRFVFAPPEPTDEVMDLYRAHSTLIQDDYGLLGQIVDDDGADAAETTSSENKNGDNKGDTSGVKWTVYGTVTHQFFDTLGFDNN